jgi:hypothetical protein
MPGAKVALTGRTDGPLLQKPLPRDPSNSRKRNAQRFRVKHLFILVPIAESITRAVLTLGMCRYSLFRDG